MLSSLASASGECCNRFETLTPFRRLRRDLAVLLQRPVESLLGLPALVFGDAGAADPPQLLDGRDAPQGALARRPDRLSGDENVHRVGVHLREVPQGHPAAAVDV